MIFPASKKSVMFAKWTAYDQFLRKKNAQVLVMSPSRAEISMESSYLRPQVCLNLPSPRADQRKESNVLLSSSLYTSVLPSISLYTSVLLSTSLYTSVLLSTSLYTSVLPSTSLYTSVLLSISLYASVIMLQHFRPLALTLV